MTKFYQPDLSENVDSPFVRDGGNKLVRRSYWLDMNDRTLVMVMTQGVGAHLMNSTVEVQMDPASGTHFDEGKHVFLTIRENRVHMLAD